MKASANLILHTFLMGIDRSARSPILSLARERTLHAGETLFRTSEPADSLFLIVAGQVAEEIPCISGSSDVMCRDQGEFLGAGCLAPPYCRLSTVKARGEVTLLEFEARAVRELCHDNPVVGFQLYERFFAVLVDRLAEARGLSGMMTAKG